MIIGIIILIPKNYNSPVNSENPFLAAPGPWRPAISHKWTLIVHLDSSKIKFKSQFSARPCNMEKRTSRCRNYGYFGREIKLENIETRGVLY